MKGPFQIERVTWRYLFLALALMARAQDELVGRLVGPRLLALGRLAPGRDRMTATRGAAFAAAVRMIDRVHDDATHMRATTEPARPAGLAYHDILVVRVAHRAHRRQAFARHDTHFTRIQLELGIARVLADQLGVGAGGTGHLAAAAFL